ncbi:MAG TPA: hypothetical protein VMT22_22045 [Terriglobales bacterium]|jgi:hypothetical protein|nr:hypothetical protein [Terriglobales bacterium]
MNLMQRLVISNLFGLGFVALSWVAVILIYEASDDGVLWPFPWLLGSLLLIVFDVGYRAIRLSQARRADQAGGAPSTFKNHWVAPSAGGSLIVLPVWAVGILLAVVFAVLSARDLLWGNGLSQ